MTSNSNEKTKKCHCCDRVVPAATSKRFCSAKCRYRFHNERRRQENQTDFAREKKLRHNVKVLKKLLQHPFYKKNRIELSYLQYEDYHFDTVTFPEEIKVAGKPTRKIAWSHNYGIEIIGKKTDPEGTEISFVTIHHN